MVRRIPAYPSRSSWSDTVRRICLTVSSQICCSYPFFLSIGSALGYTNQCRRFCGRGCGAPRSISCRISFASPFGSWYSCILSFLWSSAFLCCHWSRATSHSFCMSAIAHLLPVRLDSLFSYSVCCAIIHRLDRNPKMKLSRPISFCSCIMSLMGPSGVAFSFLLQDRRMDSTPSRILCRVCTFLIHCSSFLIDSSQMLFAVGSWHCSRCCVFS